MIPRKVWHRRQAEGKRTGKGMLTGLVDGSMSLFNGRRRVTSVVDLESRRLREIPREVPRLPGFLRQKVRRPIRG